MKTHVLVTGGGGFIGSHVVALLIKEGFEVTVLDNFSKGHREAIHTEAHVAEGDCGDRAFCRQVFMTNRFDAVLHFAAFIEAGESMKDPQRFFANNTAATLNLLEALVDAGVPKFIFSSTAATYGAPQYSPIDEEHPKSPTNAYGFTKLLVEQALDWLHDLKGLRIACLRYFNAAGCSLELGEDHSPETHLIPLLLDVAAGHRENIKVFGTDYPTPDGTCIRDYVHVEDLASAHLLALIALEGSTRLRYNLGKEQGHSVKEVIETVRQVTGHPIPVVLEDRRPGDPAVLVASSAKIKRELGWEPRYPGLEAIVRSAWAWRLAHPHGYEK